MSLPTFPELPPGYSFESSLFQIISSIAMEEIGLSHIINAEGEKIQYVLGTLPGVTGPGATLDEVVSVNESVQDVMKSITFNHMFLNSKMTDALNAYLCFLRSGGAGTYRLTVVNGSGSGFYLPGTQIPVSADPPAPCYEFAGWTSSAGGAFDDPSSPDTMFTMPDNPTTITATYSFIFGCTIPYHLTVNNGSGDGDYPAGTGVTIVAEARPGFVFVRWTGGNGGSFANANDPTTTFIMPGNNATVTATYSSLNTLDVVDGVIFETGLTSGTYAAGANVIIVADEPPAGYYFTGWTTSAGGSFVNANSAITIFTMPTNSVTVTAHYAPIGVTTNHLTVVNGLGNGVAEDDYAAGTLVSLVADAAPAGMVFVGWTSDDGGSFVNANSPTTTFTMPANDVTVTANYASIYVLTVQNGSGSGNYPAGTVVTITADPPPIGQVFDRWVNVSGGGAFGNINSSTTTFTMPANNATINATYRTNLPTIPGLNSSTQLCSYVTIGGLSWHVANTTTDSTGRYFLLISRYLLGPEPFNPTQNSVYEGSNLQSFMTALFNSSDMNALRANAVVPNMGAPSNQKNFSTTPTPNLAVTSGTVKDIVFAPTWQDVMNWAGKCTNLNYPNRWWTRSAVTAASAWEYVPAWYQAGYSEFMSESVTNTGTGVWVLPAIWVKVPL